MPSDACAAGSGSYDRKDGSDSPCREPGRARGQLVTDPEGFCPEAMLRVGDPRSVPRVLSGV